ncbi:UPF0488 protein C8orf33 homolog isoform X2 [Chanos chanos]|uniref:UPF0488 protein C8orf33 homolog isoform X2 n=1 Tax=Chanos chanos TaxID=29144 RepID=A0A6J2V308_CHACN|nr:UPF0488 protein C8orf33 homolog isoform X2 [Chanos chanos]
MMTESLRTTGTDMASHPPEGTVINEGNDCGQNGENLGSDSGFTFNFHIPAVTLEGKEGESSASQTGAEETGSREEGEAEGEAGMSQSGSPQLPQTSTSEKKKKKKKKKGAGGGEDGQQNQKMKTAEMPREESVELTPEQQLGREIDWCIEQLELGLRTHKSTPKQKEEAVCALRSLRNPKAPLVKKRQLMRALSGDYRKKMEEEKEKQFRLIQSAMTSARVSAVPKPTGKGVFHRRAELKTHTTAKPQDTHTSQGTAAHACVPDRQNQDSEQFVFAPAQEEFRFNFL